MFNRLFERGFRYPGTKRPWLPVLIAAFVAISCLSVCIQETAKAETNTDTDPPEVVNYYTADDGTDLPNYMTHFILTFNEKVWGQPNKEMHIFETEGNNCIYDLSVAGIESNSLNEVILELPETFRFKFNTAYHITIDRGAFKDASGNEYAGIDDSTVWNFSTGADTSIPSAPANLRLVSKTGTGVSLEWDESTDNDGVDYYEVHTYYLGSGDGFTVGTSSSVNSCTLTGLSPGTTYRFRVHAYDFSGNRSWPSNEVEVNIGSGDDGAAEGSGETLEAPQDGAVVISMTIGDPMMIVNGIPKEIDPGKGTAPVLVEGRTFLPVRALIEEIGGTIGWEGAENKVIIQLDEKTLELWIGSTVMRVNGVEQTMEVVPYISDTGRTMLPLRFVGESLGCVLSWDGNTSTATITYGIAGASEDETTEDTAIPDQQQGSMPWTGVWKIDMGMLILTQTGNSVTGAFGEWDENWTINGTARGSKLTGTVDYYEDPGTFEFNVSTNGSINGWCRPDGYEDWEDSIKFTGVKVSDSFGSPGTDWGGVWYTDFGPMVLTQNGSSISGVYRPYTDVSVFYIEGTVSGDIFSGRIREDEFEGTFEFELEGSGEAFTGRYAYDGDETVWTDWGGLKKR